MTAGSRATGGLLSLQAQPSLSLFGKLTSWATPKLRAVARGGKSSGTGDCMAIWINPGF